MAELVDAYGSGPYESDFMQVRFLLSAPKIDIIRQSDVDFTYYLFTVHYSLKRVDFTYYLFTAHYSLKRVDFWKVIGNSE